MARGNSVSSFGFPPFTRGVKTLIITNVAVYLGLILLNLTVPVLARFANYYFYLRPVAVMHGQLWQLISYAFIHDPSSISHLLFNMLGLWMFGAQFEQDFGTRRFYEFYFFCVIGAALTTMGVGALGVIGLQHFSLPLFGLLADVWRVPTIGASGGIFGLLIAFGILNGERLFYLYGVLPLKARYLAAIYLLMAIVGAFGGSSGVAEFAHLGGALFGWIYLRFIPRYGLETAASEGLFGIRNRYYRWKRRRAARKFEVYMRNTKRNEYFDEHGNYRAPNIDKHDDDSGWVN